GRRRARTWRVGAWGGGGGGGGCAAAWAARQAGAEVPLIEKTDMLLGTGLVGGIMRNNGRFTAAEEIIALGGRAFFGVIESVARHRNLEFPGHRHALLYDVTRIEPLVRRFLREAGVRLLLQTRIVRVAREKDTLAAVVAARGTEIRGDAFVDATGTAGPAQNCARYGTGCAMCVLRCPSFGPRVSLTAAAGVAELQAGEGFPHFEAMSGSCKLDKNSLAPELVTQLEREGVVVIPLPLELQRAELLPRKACQQYALPDYAANLILLDTGHAKLMTPFFPLEHLRTLPGFAEARYADPYSGGRGNSVRFMAIAPCDDSLRVRGVANLFCAGEKTGPLVGHTEAIATGLLAGHNAVRLLAGREPLLLPTTLAVGDIIAFMHREMTQPGGLERKYTFSGALYFERMCRLGLYTTEPSVVRARVAEAGLEDVFRQRLLKTGG
ncbi:MAG: FAD-dependent oxidoreductase, partial [Desulfotomaculales bacterium]